jgi:SAM-dependent methyltransferase
VHRDPQPPIGEPARERGDPRRGGAELRGVVVREEQDAQRIARVYEGYRQNPRKRRAWSAANAGNAAMREEVLRALLGLVPQTLTGDGLVLDAGCGGGWWLAALRDRGVASERLLGVELLAERVAAARERLPGARVLAGDVRSLALADGSCALAMLFTVLSAMGSREDVRRALGEVRRVLAPGGAVAVWEPRVWTPNRHTRLIGLAELREGLGVSELNVRSLTLLPPLARRVGRLYGPLARLAPLRTHRLIVARP